MPLPVESDVLEDETSQYLHNVTRGVVTRRDENGPAGPTCHEATRPTQAFGGLTERPLS